VEVGTPIRVTVDQSVSSTTSNPGDHFDLRSQRPSWLAKKVVIPSGAKGRGTVNDAKSAGKFKGNAELSVTLDSITVKRPVVCVANVVRYRIWPRVVARERPWVLGGAAVGALIGAIAGHGRVRPSAPSRAQARHGGRRVYRRACITIAPETKAHFQT